MCKVIHSGSKHGVASWLPAGILPTIGLALALLALPERAAGQPGSLITNVPLPVAGFGISVAVDCDGNVYFTHGCGTVSTNLYKMDKNGVLLDTKRITHSVTSNALVIDEMSWDNGRQVLWGMEDGSGQNNVYQINPLTGIATFQFNATNTSTFFTCKDGLAYDGTDDSLWVSHDVSTTIEHYKPDGTFLGAITPKNAAGSTLGSISGVTVGLGDLLYLGQNGLAQIVQVKKSNGDFISVFASPGGTRDEGLECDPVNFAPKLALWSREIGPPGFMAVIELAPDTCACGGGGEVPPCTIQSNALAQVVALCAERPVTCTGAIARVKCEKIIGYLTAATNPIYWADCSHLNCANGRAVFVAKKYAVLYLGGLAQYCPALAPTLNQLIAQEVLATKLLAQAALADACPEYLTLAQAAFNAGTTSPTPEGAIGNYMIAWQIACKKPCKVTRTP